MGFQEALIKTIETENYDGFVYRKSWPDKVTLIAENGFFVKCYPYFDQYELYIPSWEDLLATDWFFGYKYE